MTIIPNTEPVKSPTEPAMRNNPPVTIATMIRVSEGFIIISFESNNRPM